MLDKNVPVSLRHLQRCTTVDTLRAASDGIKFVDLEQRNLATGQRCLSHVTVAVSVLVSVRQ